MSDTTITAHEASEKAAAGQIIIVDIRSPAEWQSSGIAKGARPITMNQPLASFLSQLDQARGGDASIPVAFICATGNRSGFLLRQMEQSGVGNVMHVGDGMMGSRFGAGWIASGLPVERWQG
ncbi:MAG: rhodanese-like domain-containing protein [Hyphomicrobiaceae bacterium]|nr:rhodanese-like domain-containing protein [Hyphomicrobiaceae bacterium]